MMCVCMWILSVNVSFEGSDMSVCVWILSVDMSSEGQT